LFDAVTAVFHSSTRLATFDVFDTVVTRTVIRPKDLFLLMGRRLEMPDLPPEVYAELREESELALRRDGGFKREVTLAAIAAEVSRRLEGRVAAARLAAAEMAVEAASIIAVPPALPLLEAGRARFGRAVFISDTYLPEDFLRGVLERLGVLQSGDLLFCSSTDGQMKSTGELYAKVCRLLGLPADQIEHFGDNDDGDIGRARAAGWRATPFRQAAANRYEKIAPETRKLEPSLWLGLSRQTRLGAPPVSEVERVIWEVSANVSAPLIALFVDWCLRESRAAGIERLYFLSRDGEVMMQVAGILGRRGPNPIDCRYLHVSRQALLLPAIGEDLEPEMSWILARSSLLTPRIALRRAAIDADDPTIGELLDAAGFARSSLDTHLREHRLVRFREALLKGGLAAAIRSRAATAREKTLAYLAQEGLLDGVPFAIVDVGWNGTLQRSISALLETSSPDPPPVRGYYMGLRSRRQHKPADEMVACFSDVGRQDRFAEIGYIVPLIELFCAATHPGTNGYKQIDGRWVPDFRATLATADWPVATQQAAIRSFSQHLADGPLSGTPLSALSDLVLENLARFAATPARDEALVYGSFRDAEDQNDSYHHALATAYSPLAALRVRFGRHGYHHNEWRAGSLRLSSDPICRPAGRSSRLSAVPDAVVPRVVTLRAGFGPLEGPYRDQKLPRFRWIYGPVAELDLNPPIAGILNLELTTLIAGQSVRVTVGDRLLAEEPIEIFGSQRGGTIRRIELDLAKAEAGRTLRLEFATWQKDGDRPLAAILTSLRHSS
jgi:FMN phosphatase YigB (HAD superfamily)